LSQDKIDLQLVEADLSGVTSSPFRMMNAMRYVGINCHVSSILLLSEPSGAQINEWPRSVAAASCRWLEELWLKWKRPHHTWRWILRLWLRTRWERPFKLVSIGEYPPSQTL